jgi:hypothetical protein
MAADYNDKDFNKNIYCSTEVNSGCFNGQSDCRMSASLFNRLMISKNYIVELDFGRPVGYVFNQTMVEETMGKCAFVFDGASANSYNGGCGMGAPGNNCSKAGNAFENICPSTGKTCTADDEEVKGALCEPYGTNKVPSSPADGYQCIFGGPAFDYPRTGSTNHIRDMVTARVSTGNTEDHNEVIIDERLLMPAIWEDPALVIPAFVYSKSSGANGRSLAEGMRDNFMKDYQVGEIPVLEVNDQTDFRPHGPFTVPEDLEREETHLEATMV